MKILAKLLKVGPLNYVFIGAFIVFAIDDIWDRDWQDLALVIFLIAINCHLLWRDRPNDG